MLTRNVSLIEGLLNDEKKLLQFLDGKYQQYKDYNDCTLDVRYVGNKPYYSFHRTAETPLYLGSADNVFVQNIQNCRSTTSRRNSASPNCPLLSIRSGQWGEAENKESHSAHVSGDPQNSNQRRNHGAKPRRSDYL